MSGAPATAKELLRDRPETAFSRILSTFLQAHEGVRAAVFLDTEGECVDYASRVEPYEALVLSATLLNPTKALIEGCAARSEGGLVQWILEADRMDAVVRRVSEDLFVALWLEAGALSARLLVGIDPLVELLRRETSLVLQGGGNALQVETRQAKGWGYAPRSIRGSTGELEVLGRWTEPGAIEGREAVCFRVRTTNVEWTLVHDPGLERWYRR